MVADPKCPGCKRKMVPTARGGWGCPVLSSPQCIQDTKREGEAVAKAKATTLPNNWIWRIDLYKHPLCRVRRVENDVNTIVCEHVGGKFVNVTWTRRLSGWRPNVRAVVELTNGETAIVGVPQMYIDCHADEAMIGFWEALNDIAFHSRNAVRESIINAVEKAFAK